MFTKNLAFEDNNTEGIVFGPLIFTLQFGGYGVGITALLLVVVMTSPWTLEQISKYSLTNPRRSIYEDVEEGSGMGNSRGRKKEVYASWSVPPIGWYALNSDGTTKGSPGMAGGDALIRDHRGTFISANFYSCNAFRAEVMKLANGLEIARDLEICKLIINLII